MVFIRRISRPRRESDRAGYHILCADYASVGHHPVIWTRRAAPEASLGILLLGAPPNIRPRSQLLQEAVLNSYERVCERALGFLARTEEAMACPAGFDNDCHR